MNHSDSNSEDEHNTENEKSYMDMYRIVLKFAPQIIKDIKDTEIQDKLENLLVDPYQYFIDYQQKVEKGQQDEIENKSKNEIKNELEEKIESKDQIKKFSETVAQ